LDLNARLAPENLRGRHPLYPDYRPQMHPPVADVKETAAELSIEIDVPDAPCLTETECDVLDRGLRWQKDLKRSGHVGDHAILENDLSSLKNIVLCKWDTEKGEIKRIELHVTISDRLDLQWIVAERHQQLSSSQAARVKGSMEAVGYRLASANSGT